MDGHICGYNNIIINIFYTALFIFNYRKWKITTYCSCIKGRNNRNTNEAWKYSRYFTRRYRTRYRGKSPYSILVDKIQEIIDKNALTDSVKVREEDSGVVLQLSENVLFDLGKADLKPESIKVLDIISTLIPSISNEIMVQGHTDNIPISSGTYKSNWELSTARAITVLRYFIETKGFDPTRFSATGYGEYKPLVDNSTEENRAINRRVDILIVQQKEK